MVDNAQEEAARRYPIRAFVKRSYVQEAFVAGADWARKNPADMLDVNTLASRMLETWQRVDPDSHVAKYPASYVATFVDMARDIIAKFGQLTVKPDVKTVRRAISEAVGGWNQNTTTIQRAADAVLALLPGRSEVEVKAEARREVRDWLGSMIETVGVNPTAESIYRSLRDPDSPPFGVMAGDPS